VRKQLARGNDDESLCLCGVLEPDNLSAGAEVSSGLRCAFQTLLGMLTMDLHGLVALASLHGTAE
jgi:hypothetical protein